MITAGKILWKEETSFRLTLESLVRLFAGRFQLEVKRETRLQPQL
jgi:hypothetical protein